MKFLFFTDIHMTFRSPSGRKDDYATSILGKLKQVKEIGDDHEIDFYICGGDLFHIPDPSTSCVTAVTKVLKTFNKPIYTVVGSHDHFNYQFETLHRTALGILNAARVIEVVVDHLVLKHDTVFYFTHHSYVYDGEPDYYKINKGFKGMKRFVHIVHGSLYDRPLPYDYILPDEYPNNYMDLVLSGHIHMPFTFLKDNKTLFVNPGSISRVKRNENHTPSVVVVDCDKLHDPVYVALNYEKDVFKEMNDIIIDADVDFSSVFEMLESDDFVKKDSIDLKQLIIDVSKKENKSQIFIDEFLSILEDAENE